MLCVKSVPSNEDLWYGGWDDPTCHYLPVNTKELHVDQMKLYPNPTSHQINIEFSSLPLSGRLEIYDSKGGKLSIAN